MTSLDMAFTDDPHSSTSRSFPENLGSGSTPLSPKVSLLLVNVLLLPLVSLMEALIFKPMYMRAYI